MKNINTLVADIQATVGNVPEGTLFSGMDKYAINLMGAFQKQMVVRPPKIRDERTLYFSEVGDVCPRRMWYKYHQPDVGEVLPATTRIKFMYGDMLEELVLQLARQAGHEVSNEQDVVEYVHPTLGWKVRGRIDAIVDGVVIDVKSVTKYSEQKFHGGLMDDPFGYYGQLNGYATVLKSSDMGFLTIQKELGHINYFPYTQDTAALGYNIARAIKSVDRDTPVEEVQAPVPASATSPNMKLCTTCSYCAFKKKCFPEVRGFTYSGKVEWLTKVVKEPKVPEIMFDEEVIDETV